MDTIRARLEREASLVAGHFRSGGYGPWQGDGIDYHATVDAALGDLEDRCPGSGREDCLRAFRSALLEQRALSLTD
ncbi:hypothetical protein AYO40_04670 [Planctomycetaceae bacterium SCGC AG-212-D15]|nr:hypothetical protein AYO40_04670 [Planctomycetaceae bacterium SCGC AG-212-D15]